MNAAFFTRITKRGLTDESSRPRGRAACLIIEVETPGKSYFLYGFDEEAKPTGDTWHSCLGSAFGQSLDDYGPRLVGWCVFPDGVSDPVSFALGRCEGTGKDCYSPPPVKRYFVGEGDGASTTGTSVYWLEFHGELQVRQIERTPERWISSQVENWETGMTLGDSSLSDTDQEGLVEISEGEFERAWIESAKSE